MMSSPVPLQQGTDFLLLQPSLQHIHDPPHPLPPFLILPIQPWNTQHLEPIFLPSRQAVYRRETRLAMKFLQTGSERLGPLL